MSLEHLDIRQVPDARSLPTAVGSDGGKGEKYTIDSVQNLNQIDSTMARHLLKGRNLIVLCQGWDMDLSLLSPL